MAKQVFSTKLESDTIILLRKKGLRLAKKKKVSSTNNMIEIALEKLSKQSDSDFEQYYL